MSAKITLIKIEMIKKLRGELGKGKYLDTPSIIRPDECEPFCVAISSDSPISYEEIAQGPVVQCRVPIALDLYVVNRKQTDLDMLTQKVISKLLEDQTLSGQVNKLSITKSEIRTLNAEKKTKALMFDFEAYYYREI